MVVGVTNTKPTSTIPPPPSLTSINFGCPRTGNAAWEDFVHNNEKYLPSKRLGIWRFVLGWDLVPRLPELFHHVGHTIQLFYNSDNITAQNATADAYYHHYGNQTLDYAGVPFGWYNKPYLWVPGALGSHHIYKYWEFLYQWQQERPNDWIDSFVPQTSPDGNNDHDDGPNYVDDDFWTNPPDW